MFFICILLIIVIIIIILKNNAPQNSNPYVNNNNTSSPFLLEQKYKLLIRYFTNIDINPTLNRGSKTISITYAKTDWYVKYTLEEKDLYIYVHWELSANSKVTQQKTWQFYSNEDQSYIFNTVMKEAGEISLNSLANVELSSLDKYIVPPNIYKTYTVVEFENLVRDVLTNILSQSTLIIAKQNTINELKSFSNSINKELTIIIAMVFDLTTITPTLSLIGIINDINLEIQNRISNRINTIQNQR